ncbi:hypothetical protein [Campylobacter fetus]|uniref:hypothetical protein n=1 Tax=Campylobacter fetus TaxID=196 RepID=UPI0008188777|nr:hypothetical protein [Campylobacter fetus]OCR85480.1 hypothetical protein CFT12S05168_04790 [Campylobacter fetus subsp. testudinum]
MSLRNILAISVLGMFVFVGCGVTSAPKPKPAPKPPVAKVIPKYIKGTIAKIEQSAEGWKYDIRGVETSNSKLKFASAISSESGFKVGDLVYAQIEGSKITYISLIIQNYANPESSKQILKVHKRDKSKQSKIAAPVAEKLNF